MQQNSETDAECLRLQRLRVVRGRRRRRRQGQPEIPYWGGPTGIDTNGTVAGDTVYTYGNSSLRGGLEPLSPKQGGSLGDQGGGWSHNVYTVTPGIPGDSGSAFIDGQGRALGTLSTVQLAPLAGSNGVGDLAKELAYARPTARAGLTLALGTEPFSPSTVIVRPRMRSMPGV